MAWEVFISEKIYGAAMLIDRALLCEWTVQSFIVDLAHPVLALCYAGIEELKKLKMVK